MSFVRACGSSDVASGSVLGVDLDGVGVAVVRDGEDWYAVANECSHAAIPLSEGDVEDDEIECWLHGSRFDLRTGKAINLPATEPVAVYPCTVSGEDVLVDVANPLTDNS